MIISIFDNEKYTPLVWECLGYKFIDDELLDFLNSLHGFNSMTRIENFDGEEYICIFDEIGQTCIYLTVDEEKNVNRVLPFSINAKNQTHYIKLLSKIENYGFQISLINGYHESKAIAVESPSYQLNKQSVLLDEKGETEKISLNFIYSASIFICAEKVEIYKNEKEYENITSNKFTKDIITYPLYENNKEDEEEIISANTTIIGQIKEIHNYINQFTGLRYFLLIISTMGGDFAMYVPSHYLRQLPDINSIIVAKDAFFYAELLEPFNYDKVLSGNIKNSLKPISKLNSFTFAANKIKKLNNNSEIKLDIGIFDEINLNITDENSNKIYAEGIIYRGISLSPKRYRTEIIVDTNKIFKGLRNLGVYIGYAEHKLNTLNGVYWQFSFDGKYFEGFEDKPQIIEKVKNILNFDEIIEKLKVLV